MLESLTKKRKQKAYFRKEVQVAQLVTANEWKNVCADLYFPS